MVPNDSSNSKEKEIFKPDKGKGKMVIRNSTLKDDLISEIKNISDDEEKYKDLNLKKGIVTGRSVYRFPRLLYTPKG